MRSVLGGKRLAITCNVRVTERVFRVLAKKNKLEKRTLNRNRMSPVRVVSCDELG